MMSCLYCVGKNNVRTWTCNGCNQKSCTHITLLQHAKMCSNPAMAGMEPDA